MPPLLMEPGMHEKRTLIHKHSFHPDEYFVLQTFKYSTTQLCITRFSTQPLQTPLGHGEEESKADLRTSASLKMFDCPHILKASRTASPSCL